MLLRLVGVVLYSYQELVTQVTNSFIQYLVMNVGLQAVTKARNLLLPLISERFFLSIICSICAPYAIPLITLTLVSSLLKSSASSHWCGLPHFIIIINSEKFMSYSFSI